MWSSLPTRATWREKSQAVDHEAQAQHHQVGPLTGASRHFSLRGVTAQHRFVVALLASALLHGALLSLTVHRSNQAPAPEPLVMVARLLAPPPSMSAQPPVEQQQGSTADVTAAPRHAAIAKTADTTTQTTAQESVRDLIPVEPLKTENATTSTNHPLDLSAQTVTLAVRRNTPSSLAQAAREQLGNGPQPAANGLGRQIAAGAAPDCLRNSPEDEGTRKPVAIGGLLALPFMAYSAMTGKCK